MAADLAVSDGAQFAIAGTDAQVILASKQSQLALIGRAVFSRQVHGGQVIVVDETNEGSVNLQAGDALVSSKPNCILGVRGADCALIGLASPEGVIGAVHAGWRGIKAGVIPNAIGAMKQLGARSIAAVLGPCIHVECYPFGASDLDSLLSVVGPVARGVSAKGELAFDIPAAVTAALLMAGVRYVEDIASCTSCEGDWYSWRARGDVGRNTLCIFRPMVGLGITGNIDER